MFKRIDNKLKGLAQIIFWCSVGFGGVLFLYCLQRYGALGRYYYVLQPSLSTFLYPIAIILSGIVTSYLIYGFGELIGHVRNIDCSLRGDSNTSDKEDETQENDGVEI